MISASYWMVISGVLGALSNLCMRKSLDAKGSIFAYTFYQLLLTFAVCCFMHPIRTSSYSINLYTIVISVACGGALGLFKYFLGFSLKKGPSSLTFALVNSATAIPALLITLLFGSTINFQYTQWQAIGSLLVVLGIIWAISDQKVIQQKWKWLIFASLTFIAHTLYLLLMQWHVLVLENSHWLESIWLAGSDELYSEWYVPLIFAVAFALHGSIYLFKERRIPNAYESVWGILGGLFNGACAYFFMHATNSASGIERGFIFPLFSASLIISCNIWGQHLYKEQVNWRANSLCLLGVAAGTA